MAIRRQPVAPDLGRWKPVIRAYPENMEVLTEHGFLSLRDLHNSSILGKELPFNGRQISPPMIPMKELDWNQWETNEDFPLVASVNPLSGEVTYVKPSAFQMFNYTGEKLINVKAKGVDILTTVFADLLLKPKYARGWKFILADNLALNKASNATQFLINKFSQDLYGDYVPLEGLKALLDTPITLYPSKHVKYKNIWDIFSYPKVLDASGKMVSVDRVRNEVICYSLVIPGHHNMIVRRERKDNNPRTLWVGSPVVVGDGSDKSLVRINAIKKGR